MFLHVYFQHSAQILHELLRIFIECKKFAQHDGIQKPWLTTIMAKHKKNRLKFQFVFSSYAPAYLAVKHRIY